MLDKQNASNQEKGWSCWLNYATSKWINNGSSRRDFSSGWWGSFWVSCGCCGSYRSWRRGWQWCDWINPDAKFTPQIKAIPRPMPKSISEAHQISIKVLLAYYSSCRPTPSVFGASRLKSLVPTSIYYAQRWK